MSTVAGKQESVYPIVVDDGGFEVGVKRCSRNRLPLTRVFFLAVDVSYKLHQQLKIRCEHAPSNALIQINADMAGLLTS